jgi:hypothetical protein
MSNNIKLKTDCESVKTTQQGVLRLTASTLAQVTPNKFSADSTRQTVISSKETTALTEISNSPETSISIKNSFPPSRETPTTGETTTRSIGKILPETSTLTIVKIYPSGQNSVNAVEEKGITDNRNIVKTTYSSRFKIASTDIVLTSSSDPADQKKSSSDTTMSSEKMLPIHDTDSEESSLDFYLHITLGPMAVLYLIGSILVILKQWVRGRHLQRISM